MHTSALTFYSLFALVPMLAVMFGIAKGFGFDDFLEHQLQTEFQSQKTTLRYIIQFAHSMLEQSRGGLIAGVGLLFLLTSIYKMISHIDHMLNKIWNVRLSLNINKRVMQYGAIVFVSPVILICSSSFSVLVSEWIKDYQTIVSSISSGFSITMVVLLLTWLYQLLPNTKVGMKPALLAGITTGCGYVLLQWCLIQFQVVISSLGTVYGSFAALPIFLIWLQTSWVIIIYGAELSYVIQHQTIKLKDLPPFTMPWQQHQQLAIDIITLLKHQMKTDQPSLSVFEMAQKLNLSSSVIHHILRKLQKMHLIAEIKTNRTPAYILARDPSVLEESELKDLLKNHLKVR